MNMKPYQDFVKHFLIYSEHCKTNPENIVNFGLSDSETFVNNIDNLLGKAHTFEIDDDIKKLLLLTKTPPNELNKDLHLPFDSIFLDVEFTKSELDELNLKVDNERIIGILMTIGNYKINQSIIAKNIEIDDDEIVAKNIRMTVLTTNRDDSFMFNTMSKPLYIINKQYNNSNLQELTRVKKKLKNMLFDFAVNFLNFINNPEVKTQTIERNNASRQRHGKMPLPNSQRIFISGSLNTYINQLKTHKHFSNGYKFWVRGHFRVLTSERYKEMKGQRIWIPPFIKGSGILFEKNYVVK